MSAKPTTTPDLTPAGSAASAATPPRRASSSGAGERADLVRVTQGLLRRFRNRRPLRGGSLLITIFGDAIAPRGGLATLGSLIRLAAPFGLTERLVRTSVGRLARDGWLVARRDGRRSEYRLTPQGQQSFAQATSRLYAPGPNEWNGQWTLLLLPSAGARRTRAANARDRLREELRWLGFGQLNPGVFLHPGCTPEEAQEWMLALPVQEEAVLLRSSGGAPAADRRLVEAGWDLAELARRYRLFVAAFRPARQALANATADTADRLKSPVAAGSESAFIIRTLLIHEYRKIHLQDPLLPPRLLPEHWIGASAYELCRSLYSGLFTAAEDYLSATASTLEAALPRAGREVLTRFGGIGENG